MLGLIHGEDDLLGDVGVGGAEAGSFSDFRVHAVGGAATEPPADESVSIFRAVEGNRNDREDAFDPTPGRA